MKSFLTISLILSSCFSFSADIWNQKSSLPAEGRHRTTGFSIGNKGYIGLGHYNSGPLGNVAKSDIWEYNPADDSWTQKADYGAGATYGATAFTIGNYAYVGAHVYNQTQFYKFDPVGNTWTLIAPCPGGTSDHPSFTINNRGYFIATNFIYEYDPIFNNWIQHGATPTGIYSWDKAFTVDDKGYVLTDYGFFEYKPNSDTWAIRAPFPGEAVGGWSTFGINGKGYVVTGYISFLNPTSRQTWQFDPNTNQWTQLDDLPGATRRFSSSFSIGNKGYMGTGTNGTNMNDFWEFDPSLIVGIDEYATSVKIFPNPASEILNVSIPQSLLASNPVINFYNSIGSLVFTSKLENEFNSFECSKYFKGTYFYQILDEKTEINSGILILQ